MANISELSLTTCVYVRKYNSQLTDWKTEAQLYYAAYLAARKSIKELSV